MSRTLQLYSPLLFSSPNPPYRGAVGVLPPHLAGEGNEAQKDWICPGFPAGCIGAHGMFPLLMGNLAWDRGVALTDKRTVRSSAGVTW